MSMKVEIPAKVKRERPEMDPDVMLALIGLFLIIAGAIMATGVLIALPGGMAIMSNTVEQNHVAFLEEQGYEKVEHIRDPDFTSSLPESKTVYYEGTLDGTLYEIHFAPDDEKGTTEYDAFKKETDTPDKTHRRVEP